MNDYAKGVIEALTWAMTQTEKAAAKQKIKALRDEILVEAAADFPYRVKA
jgi:hypothetical protein